MVLNLVMPKCVCVMVKYLYYTTNLLINKKIKNYFRVRVLFFFTFYYIIMFLFILSMYFHFC